MTAPAVRPARELAHDSLGPRLVNNHIETYCYAGMFLQDGSTIEVHSGECDRQTAAIEADRLLRDEERARVLAEAVTLLRRYDKAVGGKDHDYISGVAPGTCKCLGCANRNFLARLTAGESIGATK